MFSSKFPKHIRFTVSCILLLLAVAWLVAKLFFSHPIQPGETAAVYTVGRKDFTVYVHERGIVQPAQIAPIASQISSNQAKIVWLVPEGIQVKKGMLVARFDTKPFMDRLEKAEQDHLDAFATYQAAQKALALQKEEEEGKIEAAKRKLEIAQVEAADILNGSGPMKRKIIEQKLHQQQRTLKLAENELDDLETLLKKGHTSGRERDRAQDTLQTAREELVVAQTELNNFDTYVWPQMQSKAKLLVAGAESDLLRVRRTAELHIQNRASEMEKYRRQVANKQKGVEMAKQDVVGCDVYAPASGILLYSKLPRENRRRKIQIGDSVWVGQTFLQIPDTSALVADIMVREVDVARIAEKMKVDIDVDAFPDTQFHGEIEAISALATEDVATPGVRKFKTRIRFLGDTGKIHVGMSVSTHIICKTLQDVLTIPLGSINYRDDGYTVMKITDGKPKEVKVVLGSQGSLWAEVKDGLSEHDLISGTPNSIQ